MNKKLKIARFVVKIVISYSLLSSAPQVGWAQNSALLEQFAGKKITTVFNSTGTSGADENNPQKHPQGAIPVTVGESSKTSRFEREVSIAANGRKGWKVALTVQKIEISVERQGQKSIYSSDNVFERDPMASAFGREFDPFVNKPVRVEYNTEGDNISKEEVNKKFETFWVGRTPMFYAQPLWQSYIVLPHLADIKPEINFAWVDSSSTEDVTYTTRYTIIVIEGDQVVVDFQGSTTPIKSSAKQEIVTKKGSRYEGKLTVNKSNYLISNANLTFIDELVYSYNGSPISTISNDTYKITNTVSDLSKK